MQFGFRTFMFFALLMAMLVLSYPLLFQRLNRQARHVAAGDGAQNQEKLDKLVDNMNETKNIPQELEKLKQAIKTMTDKLPAETDMETVVQDVWKSAQANQLTIKSIRNGKPVEGPNYNSQPIRIVIYGSFKPGFFQFLTDVEQMQRLTKIKQMKIEADDKNNGAITADVELTVYYEPSQKVAVAQ